MDFTRDEASEAAAGLAADVLARAFGSSQGHERALAAPRRDTGYDESAWKDMGRAGLLGLAVPEALAGEGLGMVATSAVLTEVGRQAAPLPAWSTLALGVLPVARFGTEAQRRRVLGGVADGERVLTAALTEREYAFPQVPRTRAMPDGGGFVLSGSKNGVRYAGEAASLLVPATTPGGALAVFLVEHDAAGVSYLATPNSSGAPEYTVLFDGTPAEALAGEDASGWHVSELYRCALAGACALGDGALAGALSLTGEHVRTREQFGRPLAAFQAVAQQVADVYVASRTVHGGALAACASLDRSPAGKPPVGKPLGGEAEGEVGDDPELASYWLAREAPAAMHTCHHLHGGLGVDVSYPMHRYYELVKDLVRLTGGASQRLDAIGVEAGR